jgi:TonB family protein
MKFWLIVILLSIHSVTLAQELKKKKSGDESFFVLASDQSVRHGEYLQKRNGAVLVKGEYDHNKKIGVWEYYRENGEIEQKYDHTQKLLIESNDLASIFRSCGLIKDGESSSVAPDHNPVFVGGYSAFYRSLAENINYPMTAKRMGVEGMVLVSVVISADGVTRDVRVLQGIGAGCDQEAIRAIRIMQPEWVPARHKEQNVDVIVVIPVNFKLSDLLNR